MHIERILPDALFKTIKPALDTFFKVLLPLLITGRKQREQTQGSEGTSHVSEKDDAYCLCNGRMKVQWLLVTMNIVHVSGFILNVWVYSANHMGNGTVVMYAGMQKHKVLL